MIKICENREVQRVVIEFDLYIPINIRFGDWNDALEPTIYWRTGDFQRSLIEIGIGEYNQEVRSITLVICDKVVKSKKMHKQFQRTIIGCPIVTISNLEKNIYTDEEGRVEIFFEENRIYILFSEIEVTSCMENENIEFLLDAYSNWVGICIKGITKENLNILRNSLK